MFFIALNPAFEMLSLSNQYAAATTEAERATYLAAGEAMLATWEGTAFQTYYFLGSVAGSAMGAVMVRSTVSSDLAGWMAILGNAIGLGLYVPTVGVYISVFSVAFLEVWYILICDDCSSWRGVPPEWRSLDEGGGPVPSRCTATQRPWPERSLWRKRTSWCSGDQPTAGA